MTVLHTFEELTPDWLTEVLHEKGVLASGHVTHVEASRTDHQASLNHFLNIKYSVDAPDSAPKTLFLKLSRPERLPLTASEYVNFCLAGLSPMLDFLRDRITPEQQALIADIVVKFPRWMLARTQQNPNHLTLIHGDSHNGNFLLPKTEGDTYAIDRQPFDWSLTCWLGVSDLTYMMVHWWYPVYRKRIEDSLLRLYHAELIQCGVANYSWEQLWLDYRLCAIQSLYVPLAWCAEGNLDRTDWIWIPKVIYTLEALEQLGSIDALNQTLASL